jgi:hypothetical protein
MPGSQGKGEGGKRRPGAAPTRYRAPTAGVADADGRLPAEALTRWQPRRD